MNEVSPRSTAPLAIRNPRTGEHDHALHPAGPAELDAICAGLRRGSSAWLERGFEYRAEALMAWREQLASDDDLLEALCVDTGRRMESVLEVRAVISSIERWCQLARSDLATPIDGDGSPDAARPSSLPFVEIRGDAVPYDLVGVISPWNFPLLLALIDAIPALLAGCAVVVKPSEVTPRFIAPIQATIARVPELAEVLAFVAGDGATGSALTDRVDLVCFTGSVATGRKVAERCGERLIPAYLELGGKDAAIVAESADLDRATSALLWGSVVNAGQSCLSIERIYVAESLHDAFVDQLVAKASELALAFPEPDSGVIGPIISAAQADIIRAHLAGAVAGGAVIRCGGEVQELGGGLYCAPTVLTGVDHTMDVATRETFGPIMPIMPFGDVDQAVSLANDSEYGLSGAVFAGTESEALAIARRLHAGAISVNDAALTAMVHDAEKNAFKHSGLGPTRMGPAAMQRFYRRKAYLVNTSAQPDPWWF